MEPPAAQQATGEPALGVSQGSIPMLPWLLAALALAGAGAWFYFFRQRPREGYAGAGSVSAFDAPPRARPAPSPAPRVHAPPPPPPPEKAKPATTGIVSTRLRPTLEIELIPERAIVDEQKAAVQFTVSVLNAGSAPARDVRVEASLFSAGPHQDQQIGAFFNNPLAEGDPIPAIGPLQRVSVSTAVVLPRDQLEAIEIEGRQLFVPMIGVTALFAWSGGAGQTSVSYLIGKTTKGEKLAPFRLDLGPRIFRNLEAREHDLRLRK